MQHSRRTSVICITVDVDPRDASTSVSQQRSLAAAASSLQSVLDSHRAPATWAMSDPAHCPLAESLLTTPTAHELALLADPSWAGQRESRAKFVSRLSQQLLHARSTGMRIGNLALARGAVIGHVDLLVKYGVQFVRDDPSALKSTNWYQRFSTRTSKAELPTPLRWGLWRLAPSVCLPGNGYTAVRRCLDTAACTAGLVTLVLDLRDLAAGGRPAMRLVDRVVSMMARRAQRDALSIEVPRDLAARLLPAKDVVPARSILRRAA